MLFLDVLYPVSNQSIAINSNFLHLLLLVNIADARAAIKDRLVPFEKAEIYLDDLERLIEIDGSLNNPSRRQHWEVHHALKMMSLCETQERVRRLLREGVLKYMDQ